jgi:large subunit ribosomal protein L10
VLKNKLVERALNELNIEALNEQLTGPNAYAFGMTDAVAPAKVIYDFISKNKKDESNLAVKAGLMGTEVMDVKAVKALSEVPSREVLLARLVGSIHAPVSNLVYALEAIRKQKAGEDAE